MQFIIIIINLQSLILLPSVLVELYKFRQHRWGSSLPAQLQHSAGGRGVPNFFQGVESSQFCYLGPHIKFRNPMTSFDITPLFRPKMPQCRGQGGPQFFLGCGILIVLLLRASCQVSIFFLIGIIIFLLLRRPRKISEPYTDPFWDFSNSGDNKKKKD